MISPAEAGASVVAGGICFFVLKSRRNYVQLPKLPVTGGATDVTVIVPARNEERSIGRAVKSFPGTRVVVVDDDSADGTAWAAREAGAEVLHAPALAPGELGKPNACRAGASVATSKWLLFVDADTWYAPTFLSSLVNYAEAASLDVVSAFLRQELVTRAERVILPYAFALYFCGVSAVRVNSPGSKDALANGQCLLVRRSSYQHLGGHAAVATSVIEDVAFAKLAKACGLSVRVVRAEHMGSVRMYDGFAAIRRGFEKNSFRFLEANPVTGAQVMLASILLTSYLPVILWLLGESHWAAAALFAIVPTAVLTPWYQSFRRALGAPLAVYAFQAIAISAMVRTVTGAGVVWKGRRV